MNSKVDLHMHSKASDGSDWIPGLLRKIQKLGIRTFALTDHDTIKGVQRMEKIVPDGIRFIRGIELSCKTEVAKCHILGYNYDLKQKEFLDFVAEAYGVRINKTHNRLRYMEEEFGFRFTAEEKEAQLKNPGKLQLKLLLEKKLRQLHPGAEPVRWISSRPTSKTCPAAGWTQPAPSGQSKTPGESRSGRIRWEARGKNA